MATAPSARNIPLRASFTVDSGNGFLEMFVSRRRVAHFVELPLIHKKRKFYRPGLLEGSRPQRKIHAQLEVLRAQRESLQGRLRTRPTPYGPGRRLRIDVLDKV